MSVFCGVWNFDGAAVQHEWLTKVSADMAQHGPDGEYFYSERPVGMVYRPFHTTAESRREQQPWVSAHGNVIAWDGRLDNAADVSRELGVREGEHSEAALALLAFERWGTSGLSRLRGDFALSIWQPRVRKLLLARDYFAVRPLLYHVTKERVLWCSDLARLVLQPGAQWTLDDSYIAGYLVSSPEAEETPYREIRGVGAAGWVEITPERIKTGQFWELDPGKRKDHCKTDADYEEAFRHLFRQSVRRRLRSDRPVLAQLSGGMDSSSIVCMADEILRDEPWLTPQLDTITHYDDCEPTGDERQWAKFVEARRGRPGYHLHSARLGAYLPAHPGYFVPAPGLLEYAISCQKEYARLASSSGSRVLLSGIGGDEFTSAVPDPIPQLGDCLLLGKWRKLVRLIREWSIVKKRPAIELLWQSLVALSPASVRTLWSERAKLDDWFHLDFVRRQHLVARRVGSYRKSRSLLPTHRTTIHTYRTLTGANSAPLWGMTYRETRKPFEDRDLVEFLTSIPDEQLLRPGCRRSLVRRALAEIVPVDVFNRRQKAVVIRRPLSTLASCSPADLGCGDPLQVENRKYVRGDRFLSAIAQMTSARSPNLIGLIRVLALECWLRDTASAYLMAGCALVEPNPASFDRPSNENVSVAVPAR